MGIFIFFLILIMRSGLVSAGEPPQKFAPDLAQLNIEELMEMEVATVYSASKFTQKITEAPSAVTIITAADIKTYGYRSLTDILRGVRGFYTAYDRNYEYIGIRGFARPGDFNTRVLLMVDGHRINDNIYSTAPIGLEFIIDVDLIERVEIIRGPSSSMYGSNAFLGVINVITKDGQGIGGVEISGEAAGFETYKSRLSYSGLLENGMEVSVSGSVYDSKGQNLYFREFNSPDANNGIAEDSDYEQYKSLFSKLKFHDFTLQAAYKVRKKGIPTASYGTVFNDPGTYTTDERAYLDLKYEHSFASQIDMTARLSYDRYHYEGDYMYDYPPLTLNKDIGDGEWWGGELMFIKRVMERHRLTVGAEYQDNIRQGQRNYDEQPYYPYFEDKRNSNVWGIYIQDEFSIAENLLFNLGARHDHYETFGGTTNPRLALIYTPAERTTIKFLYGDAFRAPNAYELYYNDGNMIQKANPALKPEKIKTYELVLEGYFKNQIHLTVSGFFCTINNLIALQSDPADNLLVFNNVENVEARGTEFEIERKWMSGMESRLSYTFQETKDLQTGDILTNSPRHLAKFNILIPIKKETVFAGIEMQYTGDRKTLDGNQADGFFITNVTLLSRNLLRNLEASASVYNLFDKTYYDPGSAEHLQDIIEQDGRSFRLKVSYRF